MQYRIKVIEYESGRKEYVPQVRRRWWHDWKYLSVNGVEWHMYHKGFNCVIYEDAIKAITNHKTITCQSIIKFVTYKTI